jgi:hypothetical protein
MIRNLCVAQDLFEKPSIDVLASMDGNGDDAAVRVFESDVTSALAGHLKSSLFESPDDL